MSSGDGDNLMSLIVPLAASIRDALQAIDGSGCEIAAVADDRRRLIGVVTDGDLRRALLQGAGLDDELAPFVTRQPLVVGPDAGRAEVLDLMTARGIDQVPIVDAEGAIVGLHIMRDLLGRAERPNWAVIMAGGRGTRLGPLTDEVPKPMIAVAGRPILERLVLHLVGAGIRRILIAVNYKADLIESHFGDGDRFGCRIEYLREAADDPLGTAGALSMLDDREVVPGCPLLVMNGDLVTQFAVGELLKAHERTAAVVTVAVRAYRHEVPFGVIETDDEDLISAVVEKPTASWNVNAGIYVLEPEVLRMLPRNRYYEMPQLVADCLAAGKAVRSWRMEDDWQDVGRPNDLQRARGEL